MTKTNMHFRLKTKTKSKIAAKINTAVQDVDVSILFHYGYIQAIEFSAYLFIHCHLQCSYSAFIYVRTSRWLGLGIMTINVKQNC